MSAFYDQASLVVVPSGYKSGKIYAQKPLTTDGQLTFTRASTATRVNASGLIEEVASGVPRLDYLASTCPKLLLEPQRTNAILRSEEFDATYWGKAASGVAAPVVTANQSLAPNGTTTADRIVFPAVSNATNFSVVYNITPITTSGSNVSSVYLKGEVGGEKVYVFMIIGSTWTNILCTLTTDWQRFSVPFTGGGNTYFHIGLDLRTGSGQVGQSGSTVYAWAAQVEAGAYATSYVKTETAAVTRLADYAVKTGISSLIGQTEGTVFAEFEVTHQMTGNNILFSVSDGTTNQNIYANIFLSAGVNRIEYVVNNGGVLQMNASSAISNGTHKIALAYKANDFAVFIDGTQVHTDTSGTVPATSRLGIGTWVANSLNYSDGISQALLFKTRLTNAQLAELTTL
jgi:hypothetical protein